MLKRDKVTFQGREIILRKIYEYTDNRPDLKPSVRATIRQIISDDAVVPISPKMEWGNDEFWAQLEGQPRLTVRISKHIKQAYNHDLSVKALSKIGQLAKENSSRQMTYYFDITDQFDWEDGEFGHGGSCWWGGNKFSKSILRTHGGLCLRLYHRRDKNPKYFAGYRFEGYSRTWIETSVFKNESWMLFNNYGLKSGLYEAGRILAGYFGVNHYQTTFEQETEMFVNGDNVCVIGPHERTDTRIWADWENEAMCELCDKLVHRDDAYFGVHDVVYCKKHRTHGHPDGHECEGCGNIIDLDESEFAVNGDWYCDDCYRERFTECDMCGNTLDRDETHYIESESANICEGCLDRFFTTCDHCGENVRDRNVIQTDSSPLHEYCQNCAEDHTFTCEVCSDTIHNDQGYHLEGKDLCRECNDARQDEIDKEEEDEEERERLEAEQELAEELAELDELEMESADADMVNEGCPDL